MSIQDFDTDSDCAVALESPPDTQPNLNDTDSR